MKAIWNNPVLMNIMKDRYIKAQIKKGVDFKGANKYWSSKKIELSKLKNVIEDKSINYPSYFTEPIHTYQNGHLNIIQSYETTCHMECSALNSMQDITNNLISDCTPKEAYSIYKNHIVSNIINEIDINKVKKVADFGCGTGDITYLLDSAMKYATITGIDLSPNYLAIAMYKYKNIEFLHRSIETSNLEENSYDLVTINFAFHEMIPIAIENTIKEAYRILNKNGKLVIIDMDPEILPEFPSFIDISEPHLREYRQINILSILLKAGFKEVNKKRMHRMSSKFTGEK